MLQEVRVCLRMVELGLQVQAMGEVLEESSSGRRSGGVHDLGE